MTIHFQWPSAYKGVGQLSPCCLTFSQSLYHSGSVKCHIVGLDSLEGVVPLYNNDSTCSKALRECRPLTRTVLFQSIKQQHNVGLIAEADHVTVMRHCEKKQ